MTTPDLDTLAALTRDYAAFQTRKSGLATALGGLMAILLAMTAFSPAFMGARLGHRLLLEYLVWTPLLWLLLKGLLARALYRGAGTRALAQWPFPPEPECTCCKSSSLAWSRV
ncbi:MAG: hypothetical protein KGI56_01400 [Acidobacteriota bacterium]|nr:hypothetical protein [Acidobacteriota bacterium]